MLVRRSCVFGFTGDYCWGWLHGDDSYTESPELLKELVKQVATHIGPFARPGMIVGTPGLPKTRSGENVCVLL